MRRIRPTVAFAAVWMTAALGAGAAGVEAPTPPASTAPAASDPANPLSWIEFGQDFTSNCVARQGVGITVRSTHPTRTVRIWLDRIHMGIGTGDRSRTDLRPGAEPEALGCSRTDYGLQEWRPAKAQFVD